MLLEPKRPWTKVAVLSALYFAQGLPFGFQATALPVYLRQRGVSLTAIGFAGALSAPWMLKALWAPLVDRFGWRTFGRRKSWIAPMQLLLSLSCAAAAVAAPSGSLTALLSLVFVMNLFAATQDIAVDGLAVDLLGPEELGYGNAAQVVGYKLGMLTGGGLLVWASRDIGWEGLFGGMALLCAGVLVLTMVLKEPPATVEGGAGHQKSLREVLASLAAALRLPGAGWLILFIATYKLGEAMVDAMFKPFLVDAHFGVGQIGLWVGTWGLGASIAGSLLGGALASRLGPLPAVGLAAAARSVALLAQWSLAVAGPTANGVIAVSVLEHLAAGALTTAMFAFMMSKVDRRIGATHYTLLASIEVLGKSPAAWASGPIAQVFGYGPLFLVGAVLSVCFLGLLVPLRRLERREMPVAEPS